MRVLTRLCMEFKLGFGFIAFAIETVRFLQLARSIWGTADD